MNDRLNLVIDTDTGKASEQFNDNLSRMGKGLDGIGNVIAQKTLPTLVKLTDIIVDPKTATAAGVFVDWVGDVGAAALDAAGNPMPFIKA